jgi:serine/threonine protein kinase
VCAAGSTVDDLAPDSQEDRIAEALLSYQKAVEAGRRPDHAEFLRRHVDIAEQLEPLLSAGQHADALLSPLRALAADDKVDSQATRSYQPLDSPAILPPGTVLMDRYCIERELGRGGMGQVYLARDQVLQRLVAVKLIRPLDPNLRDRTIGEAHLREAFVQEAILGASLNHPAIATVFDFGFHNEEPLIVFEYVDGETLHDTVAGRGALPLDDARLILASLAQALHFAHSRHIVHRDLKPANIRSTIHGQFKILDLGLAVEFREAADWRFVGTPRYASPEQAAGSPCDGRTDQYALALIAFEMMTGRPVFSAASRDEVLRLHREQQPPALRTLVPNAPESVENALARALAKDPNRRFASCEEFAAALGCQFLTRADSPTEVLRLARVTEMDGVWSCRRRPFWLIVLVPILPLVLARVSLPGPIHLALAGNSIWAYFRGEMRCWPLSDVQLEKTAPQSWWLQLRIGGSSQSIRFRTATDCTDWYWHIHQLLESLPVEHFATSRVGLKKRGSRARDADARIARMEGQKPFARVEPVVLLRRQPSSRYQTLGMADCKANDRALAETGLKVRAALMGADAVIDVQEERLAELDRTRWRRSGTAIRAIDSDGRHEMFSRWFAGQCKSIANQLLLFVSLVVVFRMLSGLSDLFFGLGRPAPDVSVSMAIAFAAFVAWPVAVLVWLRAALIPQVLRPASLTVLLFILTFVAYFVLVLVEAILTKGRLLGSEDLLLFLGGMPIEVVFVLVAMAYCKRAWTSYRQYEQAVREIRPTHSTSRRLVAISAWTTTALFALALVSLAVVPDVLSVAARTNLGNRLAVSAKEEIYYRNVTKAEASKLGDLLQRIEVFDGKAHRTVIVEREADAIKVTFVVIVEGFWNREDVVRKSVVIGQAIRSEVFGGAALEVQLADVQLNVKKTVAIR